MGKLGSASPGSAGPGALPVAGVGAGLGESDTDVPGAAIVKGRRTRPARRTPVPPAGTEMVVVARPDLVERSAATRRAPSHTVTARARGRPAASRRTSPRPSDVHRSRPPPGATVSPTFAVAPTRYRLTARARPVRGRTPDPPG